MDCPEAVGAVALDGDDNVAVFDFFDILLGEDRCTVVITELSDRYEGESFEALEDVDLLQMIGKVGIQT